MGNLKTIHELVDGDCIVVTKLGREIKEYSGCYCDKYQCVFFAIPAEAEILGYKQDR